MQHAPRLALPTALLLLLAGPLAAQSGPAPRQVAAPAADLVSGRLRLPDPARSATRSTAWMVAVEPEVAGSTGAWSFELELPVNRPEGLALALVSPDAAHWRLRVLDDAGRPRELTSVARAVERSTQLLVQDLPGWVVDRRDVLGARTGLWRLVVDDGRGPDAPPPARGWLVVAGDSPVGISTHVATHRRLSDEPVAVLAHAFDVDAGALARGVSVARTRFEDEFGAAFEREMHDDGAHEDGAAGDGVFGALVPAGFVGRLRAHVELRGSDASGAPFARSAFLAFGVQERRALFSGEASAHVLDEKRLALELSAWPLGPADPLHVSAEVWGTAADGSRAPVCWLSTIREPELRAGRWDLALELDGRWLDVSGLSTPLELRAVRLQDPGTHVVFDELDRVALDVDGLPDVVGRGAREVTREMLTGPSAAPSRTPAAHVPAPRALMLVHGYCSGGMPWPPSDFTQPKRVFFDPDQNRSHDEFAQLLAQTGSDLFSFGVVGHSQGGPAALHLYTYYQSPLDTALGERLIQSVGAPYQGTPLASLGSFACGVNDDLTPAGSAAWLAGIPSWARSEVFYWTTSNAGSACNFLASLVLADPEDGTTEMFRGQLPGGNSMGHVTGWCHTTGMSEPAQSTDASRNAEMNARAAR